MENVNITILENPPSAPGEAPMIYAQMDLETTKYVSQLEHQVMELTVLTARYRAVMQAAWNGVKYEELEEFLQWQEEQGLRKPPEDQMSLEEVET